MHMLISASLSGVTAAFVAREPVQIIGASEQSEAVVQRTLERSSREGLEGAHEVDLAGCLNNTTLRTSPPFLAHACS